MIGEIKMIIGHGFSKWMWGLLLLLAAALLIVNQVGGFAEFGVGSIITGVICLAIIIQSIIGRSFAVIPFPIAALYLVFHSHFGWPNIGFWILFAAAILTSAGLAVLLPSKIKKKIKDGINSNSSYDFDGDYTNGKTKSNFVKDDNERNFDISLSFGGVSRYLRSDCLETAKLSCSFGGLEVYFDEVELSPNGAEVLINCSFGGIDLYIPKHWNVVENINTTLGGVDTVGRRSAPSDDSPTLTIRGSVSFGGVDIHYV